MSTLTEPGRKITHYLVNHPEILVHRKEEGFSYPISAEIDLTWRCALNCKGCHSKWLHQDQELSFADIIRIIDQLAGHGCKSVTWSGGGDPMESPWFWNALDVARYAKLNQGLYSYFPEKNQIKLQMIEEHCKFFYSHPFKPYALKRHPDRPCVVTAGFLLDSENWMKMASMVQSVDLSFFDFVDFRPLCPINTLDAPMLRYDWIPAAIEMLENISRFNPQVTWAQYKFEDLLKENGGRDYASCLSTDFVACIGPNGDMYECLNRRGFPDSVLGNLLIEDLSYIWERKRRSREDFNGCRILCRGHEDNKALYQIMGPAPRHEAFV